MQSVGEHIRCQEGSMINGRYRVVAECGAGNFARVYKCVDTTNNQSVAVKFLKREYARDAAFEVDVLKSVTRHDPAGKEKVLRLLDHFNWNRFPAFVFPLKGATLKSRRSGVSSAHNIGGFSRDEYFTLASDLVRAVTYLHTTVRVVHTDLKPENVLQEHGAVTSSGSFYIADFGSASFYSGKLESDLISTRPYRCPEVVIGLGWSFPADVWSLGCILFEMFTGQSFIPHTVHTDHEQLVCMQQRLMTEIPPAMAQRGKQRKLFDYGYRLLPCPFRRDVLRPMREMLRGDDLLLDLLEHMLILDPTVRIRAEHLLDHPYFSTSRSSSVGHSTAATVSPRQIPVPALAIPNSHHVVGSNPGHVSSHLAPGSARQVLGAVPTSARQQPQITAADIYRVRKGLQAPPPPTITPRHEYGLYGLSR